MHCTGAGLDPNGPTGRTTVRFINWDNGWNGSPSPIVRRPSPIDHRPSPQEPDTDDLTVTYNSFVTMITNKALILTLIVIVSGIYKCIYLPISIYSMGGKTMIPFHITTRQYSYRLDNETRQKNSHEPLRCRHLNIELDGGSRTFVLGEAPTMLRSFCFEKLICFPFFHRIKTFSEQLERKC